MSISNTNFSIIIQKSSKNVQKSPLEKLLENWKKCPGTDVFIKI